MCGLYRQSRHQGAPLSGNGGNPPEVRFPDATSSAGLSEGASGLQWGRLTARGTRRLAPPVMAADRLRASTWLGQVWVGLSQSPLLLG